MSLENGRPEIPSPTAPTLIPEFAVLLRDLTELSSRMDDKASLLERYIDKLGGAFPKADTNPAVVDHGTSMLSALRHQIDLLLYSEQSIDTSLNRLQGLLGDIT